MSGCLSHADVLKTSRPSLHSFGLGFIKLLPSCFNSEALHPTCRFFVHLQTAQVQQLQVHPPCGIENLQAPPNELRHQLLGRLIVLGLATIHPMRHLYQKR